MTINRTVTVDGIAVSLSIPITDEEIRSIHRHYQDQLDAEAEASYLKFLGFDNMPAEEELAATREYVREHYAADLALNETEEEQTDD